MLATGSMSTLSSESAVADVLLARLLLVDDKETVRATLAEVLAKEGYAVTALASGRSALVAVPSERFDVVVCDLQLGDGVDGLTVLTEAEKHNPEVVTVLLTGYGSMASAVEAVRRGVLGYLLKPCNLDELKAIIRAGQPRRLRTAEGPPPSVVSVK